MVGCAWNTNVCFIAEPSSSVTATSEIGVPLPPQGRASVTTAARAKSLSPDFFHSSL